MSDPMIRTYTLTEAAALLSLSRRQLERYVRDGELRVVRFGRAVRVTERELAAFVKARAAA